MSPARSTNKSIDSEPTLAVLPDLNQYQLTIAEIPPPRDYGNIYVVEETQSEETLITRLRRENYRGKHAVRSVEFPFVSILSRDELSDKDHFEKCRKEMTLHNALARRDDDEPIEAFDKVPHNRIPGSCCRGLLLEPMKQHSVGEMMFRSFMELNRTDMVLNALTNGTSIEKVKVDDIITSNVHFLIDPTECPMKLAHWKNLPAAFEECVEQGTKARQELTRCVVSGVTILLQDYLQWYGDDVPTDEDAARDISIASTTLPKIELKLKSRERSMGKQWRDGIEEDGDEKAQGNDTNVLKEKLSELEKQLEQNKHDLFIKKLQMKSMEKRIYLLKDENDTLRRICIDNKVEIPKSHPSLRQFTPEPRNIEATNDCAISNANSNNKCHRNDSHYNHDGNADENADERREEKNRKTGRNKKRYH